MDTAYIVVADSQFSLIVELFKYLGDVVIVQQGPVVVSSQKSDPCNLDCLCQVVESTVEVVYFIAAFLVVL